MLARRYCIRYVKRNFSDYSDGEGNAHENTIAIFEALSFKQFVADSDFEPSS